MHTYHIISLDWRQIIFLQCFMHNVLLKGYKVLIWQFRLPLTCRLHHKCHEMLMCCQVIHADFSTSGGMAVPLWCSPSAARVVPPVVQRSIGQWGHCGRPDPDEDCRSTAVQIFWVQIKILVLFYRNWWCSRCRNSTEYVWSDEEAATFLQIVHTKKTCHIW